MATEAKNMIDIKNRIRAILVSNSKSVELLGRQVIPGSTGQRAMNKSYRLDQEFANAMMALDEPGTGPNINAYFASLNTIRGRKVRDDGVRDRETFSRLFDGFYTTYLEAVDETKRKIISYMDNWVTASDYGFVNYEHYYKSAQAWIKENFTTNKTVRLFHMCEMIEQDICNNGGNLQLTLNNLDDLLHCYVENSDKGSIFAYNPVDDSLWIMVYQDENLWRYLNLSRGARIRYTQRGNDTFANDIIKVSGDAPILPTYIPLKFLNNKIPHGYYIESTAQGRFSVSAPDKLRALMKLSSEINAAIKSERLEFTDEDFKLITLAIPTAENSNITADQRVYNNVLNGKVINIDLGIASTNRFLSDVIATENPEIGVLYDKLFLTGEVHRIQFAVYTKSTLHDMNAFRSRASNFYTQYVSNKVV